MQTLTDFEKTGIVYFEKTSVVWKQVIVETSTRLTMGNDQKRTVENRRPKKIETITNQTNESMVSNLAKPQDLQQV